MSGGEKERWEKLRDDGGLERVVLSERVCVYEERLLGWRERMLMLAQEGGG
jgi:hypothetical protein